ncbi:MAG: biofilm PGA synthesis protein PgaB, partial [Calditrichia bacterium]|nr:biofilm PGA synthesis protein PgaB [Calditrichia bacterium]
MKYKNIILIPFLLILISSCQKQVKTGSEKFIKVAVFKGFGASPKCISDAVESLKIDSAITPIIITADNILNNGLKNIDVLLFAGGSGSKQMSNMGNLVVKKVQDFVYYEGRGVVGICAGAYLLSDTPDYTCMHLCPAEAIDREHDERGHGLVKFSLTEEGKKIFPELSKYETAFMQYYEGPVLIPATKKYAQFTKLAVMLSDVHLENDAPADMTNNK